MRQITDLDYPVKEVADRLRITTYSLHAGLKRKFNATRRLMPASAGHSHSIVNEHWKASNGAGIERVTSDNNMKNTMFRNYC